MSLHAVRSVLSSTIELGLFNFVYQFTNRVTFISYEF